MLSVRMLNRIPAFRGLEEDSVQDLLSVVNRIEVAPYQPIFQEDEDAKKIYFLESGRVLISIRDGAGGRKTVHVARPGECFGWSALVPPYVFFASAHAQEPSEVDVLDADALRMRMRRHPDLAWNVFEALAATIAEGLAGTRVQLLAATLIPPAHAKPDPRHI